MGTIMIDEATGRRFEWIGDTRKNTVTHCVNKETGFIYEPQGNEHAYDVGLRLISPRHTFGGVVYEETGEKRRHFKRGEAFLGSISKRVEVQQDDTWTYSYDLIVVKPIGTISDDGKTLYRNDGTTEDV